MAFKNIWREVKRLKISCTIILKVTHYLLPCTPSFLTSVKTKSSTSLWGDERLPERVSVKDEGGNHVTENMSTCWEISETVYAQYREKPQCGALVPGIVSGPCGACSLEGLSSFLSGTSHVRILCPVKLITERNEQKLWTLMPLNKHIDFSKQNPQG